MDEIKEDKSSDVIVSGFDIENQTSENTTECSSTAHPAHEHTTSCDDGDVISIDPAVIEKLTLGTLEHYLPNLQRAKSNIDEIIQNQNILTETVQQENTKFSECSAMGTLEETMVKARKYYAKLNSLKKEMAVLSEKSFKLKKRALKLQQQKTKQELQREHEKDNELERERKLVAQRPKMPTEK